jgi:hypothetical protein
MIDAAKIADLALLLIDGSYGFEMVCVVKAAILTNIPILVCRPSKLFNKQ